jgi:hypothetical protein
MSVSRKTLYECHFMFNAFDEGMVLDEAFLVSCGAGVATLGIEEPADRITNVNGATGGIFLSRRMHPRNLKFRSSQYQPLSHPWKI